MAEQKTETDPTSPDADESSYRPYSYNKEVQNNPNGKGILFTEWSTDHQFNYFRYWIGRSVLFCDNAKEISNALRTVIMREEYDLDDVRDDLLIENEEDESMIIAEAEFEQFEWNKIKKRQFCLICCEVIDILPFYKEWINELKSLQNVDDFENGAVNRFLIIFKFYKRWIAQNFGDNMTPKNKFHFAVRDFLHSLEYYESEGLSSNDWPYLYRHHVNRLNQAMKRQEWNESDSEDDQNQNDESNQNVYELFEEVLGEVDVKKCTIYERKTRSRFDDNFNQHKAVNYALNEKELKDKSRIWDEIRAQENLDAVFMAMFHTQNRYVAMGLGDSEEYRRFLQYDINRIQTIKQMNAMKSKPYQ